MLEKLKDAMLGSGKQNDTLRDKYFDRKKTEFEVSCNQGDAGACYSLGEWWLMFGKDVEKAHALFKSACEEKGHGNACFMLAQLYQGGKLPGTDEERKAKSYELYMKACQAKNNEACGMAGTCKLQGFGCEKDVDGAKILLQSGCAENDSNSCFRLGRLYLDGQAKYGVERELSKAFPYMLKACELGQPNACQVVSVMYLKGDGVEASKERHDYYKERTMQIVKQLGNQMGASVVDQK